MKFNKNILFLLICLCFLNGSVSAQKFLEKPYQKWGKDDAMKLLTESPWAKTYQSIKGAASAQQQQLAREQSDTVNRGGGNPRSYESSAGPPPVVVRLHSALPVRQALIRLRQIAVGYDKMDEKQRAEFDKASEGFLTCQICKDYYVVTITKYVDSSGRYVDEGVFQGMNFEQLKGNIWLSNDRGERRELAQFTPPKNASDMAIFFFARLDDKGNPFLTPENKEFEFVFDESFFDGRNRFGSLLPRHFEFKVSKLMVGDNLIF